jgi:hypothetical protein
MPPTIKPGTPDRYWAEAERLNRLAISLERDASLQDAERTEITALVRQLHNRMCELARRSAG